MSLGGQRYGIQVGNETYSVIVTDDDWEKRKLERERQRHLSQETNRRRKALEERKKIAEEREARKRTLQLSKRRQRQTEATEKYQRAHLGVKHEKKLKSPAGSRKNTLDNVMYQLRSGNLSMNYSEKPTESNRNISAQLANQGRMKFESKLQEEQQRLLEQHKLFIEKEFKDEIKRNATITEHQQRYNMGTGSDAKEKLNMHQYLPAYTGQVYSNIDLMSGQMRDYSSTEHTPNRDYAQFADSISRLFIKQQDDNKVSGRNHPNDPYQLQIEDADDDISASTKQSKATPPMNASIPGYNKNEMQHHASMDTPTRDDKFSRDQAFDDQDSLHGSISSGNSPVYSTMTSFHKKYNDSFDGDAEKNYSGKNLQPDSNEGSSFAKNDVDKVGQLTTEQKGKSRQNGEAVQPQQKNNASIINHDSPQSDRSSNVIENQSRLVKPPDITLQNTPSIPRTIDRSIPSSNYYLKSFRPWSAAVNSQQQEHKSVKHRPMSAVVTGMAKSLKALEGDKVGYGRAIGASEQTNKQEKDLIPDHTVRWAGGIKKTNATPISIHYAEAWASAPESDSKSPIFGAQPPAAAVPPTTIMFVETATSSGTVPTSDSKPRVEFSSSVKTSSKTEFNVTSANSVKPRDVVKSKSILRKHSKYDHFVSKPIYHSAAVTARQQWVDHIVGGAWVSEGTKKATLNGVEVRDSMEERQQSPSKSVRWHEIHYNDGTTATISESGAAKLNQPPQTQETNPTVSIKRAPKPASKAHKSKPGKGKPPPNDKPAKKGGKGNKGRKLKVAKDAEVPMEPHPPPSIAKKQLAVSSSLNYSIASTSANGLDDDKPGVVKPQQSAPTRSKHNRVAWVDEAEGVTMDTLKSSGSPETNPPPPPPPEKAVGKRILHNSSSTGNANQITIHVVRPENNEPSQETSNKDALFNLSKTPTDQEINWLWDKVRNCLSQRTGQRSGNPPLGKSASDTSRYSGLSANQAQRQAWGSPSSAQQRASIISIDGALFMRDSASHNSNGQPRNRRLVRPSSAITLSGRHSSRVGEYGTYLRRQALAQQRRQKQFVNYRNKADVMKSISKYPPPKQSYFEPLNSPSTPSSAPPYSHSPSSGFDQVDDSTTAFLLAETLAEQNMSEEQIMQAMESLHKRTKNAQSAGRQVMPSALSVEENRLLKSLDRLNTRLRDVQTAMSGNTNFDFFQSTKALHEFRPPTAKSMNSRSPPDEGRYQRSYRRY